MFHVWQKPWVFRQSFLGLAGFGGLLGQASLGVQAIISNQLLG